MATRIDKTLSASFHSCPDEFLPRTMQEAYRTQRKLFEILLLDRLGVTDLAMHAEIVERIDGIREAIIG